MTSSAVAPNHVGIITYTRNNPLLLGRALESVLDQGYSNWTHIIINDGGAPEPAERLIERYRERYAGRVVLIHHPSPFGFAVAVNQVLVQLKADYIALHDDCDTWDRAFLGGMIDSLRLQQQVINNLHGIMCWSTLYNEHFEGFYIYEDSAHSFNSMVGAVRLQDLAARDFMPAIGFIFERGVIDEIGLLDEQLPGHFFREFVLRFLKRFDIAVMTQELAHYRHCMGVPGDIRTTLFPIWDRQVMIEAQFRNEMLRRDLKAGVQGLGFLMVVSSGAIQTPDVTFFPTRSSVKPKDAPYA
jgi:glycosyltransferase involved in cell wall biosynthesis